MEERRVQTCSGSNSAISRLAPQLLLQPQLLFVYYLMIVTIVTAVIALVTQSYVGVLHLQWMCMGANVYPRPQYVNFDFNPNLPDQLPSTIKSVM